MSKYKEMTDVNIIVADNLEPDWVHEDDDIETSVCSECRYCYIDDEDDRVAFCTANNWFMHGEEIYEENLDGEVCPDFEDIGY